MPTLAFTVLPAGVAQLHDLLSCLAKFDENVSLEACNNNVGNLLSPYLTNPADLLVPHLQSQQLQNCICFVYSRRRLLF
jgi:hypothetical protein